MSLNVLLISIDSTLAVDEDNIMGNAKARHIEYAKHLENFYIVVKTSKSINRKVRKIKDNLFVYPTSSLNRYFFLCDAYKVASKICRKNRIDFIMTQDPFITGLIGWLLKKKYNIPLNIQIVADMVDNKYFIRESIFNLFLNKLAKLLISKADTIRVVNSKEKNKLVKLGIEDKKIWHIPVFIDFFSFQQSDDNSIGQLNLNGKFDKIVLSVNRLSRQKNIETLIRAIPYTIKKYPKCLFLIVGSGPEEKYLKRLAFNLRVEEFIKFQGQVSFKDLPRYFQAADIFVTTSHYEGNPMAIQEAAAAKKPIISTPHAGVCDVLKESDTGFIVDFGDSQQLAQRITHLLKNPELASKMGEKGQKFVLKNFNKDKILTDYLTMWLETSNYKNKTSGTRQKKKLWLTMFFKQLGILTYAKELRKVHLSFISRKRYIKFYINPNMMGKFRSPPLYYSFEPTLQCNLKCNFCYEKDLKKESSKEMSLGQFRRVFDSLKLDDQVVNLTGGEIFVRKDIFEILEYFKGRNVWSYIVTNGTVFEENIVNNLRKYNIRGIEFSLDGPEDVHNQIRNSPDAFKKLIKAIELTKDKFRVTVKCVIQEKNIDSLTEVVLTTHSLKIKELNFQPEVFTTPKALDDTKQILGWDDLAISLQVKSNPEYYIPIEIWEIKWNEVKRMSRRLGMDINIYPSLFEKYKKIDAQRKLRNSKLRLMCYELLTGRIDPYGNVIPCYIIRKNFGNLLKASFEGIWNSQDFKEFRYKMAMNNLLPICENCCKLRLI